MPQRPPSHVVGDEALLAVQQLFLGWVVRPTGTNDYGVDAEVEIFESDHATGLSFKAQVKGTAARKRGKRYPIKVKRSTLNYWRSLDVPVLVCLYAKESGDIYVRWAHSYDPIATKSKRRTESSLKVTFSFGPEDRVPLDPKRSISQDVTAFKALRERAVVGPIPIRVVQTSRRLSDEELRTRLGLAFQVSGNAIRIAEDQDVTPGELRVEANRFRFAMPIELASLRVTHGKLRTDIAATATFVADVTVAAAVVFANIGLSRQAYALARENHRVSTMASNFEIAHRLASVFVMEGDADEALRVLAPFYLSDDANERYIADLTFLLLMQSYGSKLSDGGLDVLLSLLEQRASIEHANGDDVAAAQVMYGKAQAQRSAGRWLDALESFGRTVVLDDSYEERGYYHRERGGCFADLGQWFQAVEAYERAKECADYIVDIDFVLADSLLHAGRYADALRLLRAESTDELYYQQKSKVVGVCCDWVVERLGVGNQARHQMLESTLRDRTADSIADVMELMTETDALDRNLCARYLGLISSQPDGDDEAALGVAAIFAHMALSDCNAWLLATLLATEVCSELAESFATMLAFFCRDSIPAALDEMRERLDDTEYSALSALVYREASKPRQQRQPILRLYEKDGEQVEIIEVPTIT